MQLRLESTARRTFRFACKCTYEMDKDRTKVAYAAWTLAHPHVKRMACDICSVFGRVAESLLFAE